MYFILVTTASGGTSYVHLYGGGAKSKGLGDRSGVYGEARGLPEAEAVSLSACLIQTSRETHIRCPFSTLSKRIVYVLSAATAYTSPIYNSPDLHESYR